MIVINYQIPTYPGRIYFFHQYVLRRPIRRLLDLVERAPAFPNNNNYQNLSYSYD